MKTMIAIPCMDAAPVRFMESLLDMEKPEGTKICFRANSLVYDSRNLLSLTAIEQGYDRVLWLDSDMIFPQDTLVRLSMDMDEGGYDMVTGLYFKRRFPVLPVIYDQVCEPEILRGKPIRKIHEYVNYPQEETIFSVAGCGFGCVMTSTKLLKSVWDNFGPAFQPYPWAGEDLSFCYRVGELGYPIICDGRISCGHIGQMIFNEQLYDQVEAQQQA